MWETFLQELGLLVVIWSVFKIVRSLWRGVYRTFLADYLGHTVQWSELGPWAVITGATDGIGKSYASALAAKGFNIVLISRNPEKLQNVAKELETAHNVQTQTIAVNMTGDAEIYDDIEKRLKNLDIGVLINNVGKTYGRFGCLTDLRNGKKLADEILKLNIVTVVKMTQIVLPEMERQKKGVIINISSIAGYAPCPRLSMYGASKTFVDSFSRATQEEYRSKGIIVQSVAASCVSTNMLKIDPNLLACKSDDFVYWALKSVGVEERTYGYPSHRLQGYVHEVSFDFLPEYIFYKYKYFEETVMIATFYRLFNARKGKRTTCTDAYTDEANGEQNKKLF